MTPLPPIRREIVVDAEPDLAFAVFTDQLGTWWPLGEFSVHGAESTVGFLDGAIVETAADGKRAIWGEVTGWEPPESLAFTWHPGKDADAASRVSVTFTAAGEQTLVRLEHDGWEVFADPQAARAEYDHGWPAVLHEYAARTSESRAGTTWVALVHRPAAGVEVASLFADPRFADHLAFLARMRAAGYLVAAGPLEDEPGTGMAVLRLPGTDRYAEAARLAREDDASVVGGFFDVTVRPWRVQLHA